MSAGQPPPAREVRVSEYARRVVRRWYVVVAAVIIAVGLVFLRAVSGNTNQATATAAVYLGQPIGPSGGGIITQTPQANPQIAVSFVRSAPALATAAKAAGIHKSLGSYVSVLATNPSVGGTAGANTKGSSGAPTIAITVEGPWSRVAVQRATESLANQLLTFENRYPSAKQKLLTGRIGAEQKEVTSLQTQATKAQTEIAAIDGSSLSPEQKAATAGPWGQVLASLTTQLGDTSNQLANDQIALQSIASIESAQFISHAAGHSVGAVKRRSSLVVAAFIGLIVGIGLALLWDVVRSRVPTAA
jgi:hypothetical protein